jgi:cytochrome P450
MMYTDARMKNVEFRRCYPDGGDDAGLCPVDPQNVEYVTMRKMVTRQFTPEAMRRLRPRIQRIVDELLDAALEAGDVDLVEAFGFPVATLVACEYFGIPASDRGTFRGWVDAFVACGDGLVGDDEDLDKRRGDAMAELQGYFRSLIPSRRHTPTDDLVGSLVTALDAIDPALTDRQLPDAVSALLMSGYEATGNFLSGATYDLLTHPAELRLFRDNPGIAASAVSELMRYWTPTSYIARSARTDVELDGQVIRAGDTIFLVMAAANRDPEVFDDPDRLDLTRHPNPHIAFGHGPHVCIGAVLTEMEAQLALGALVRRAPALELRGEPKFKTAFAMRGFSTMPVSLR